MFLILGFSHLTRAAPNELAFINRIANIIHFINQHQQEVWPGFHISDTASIVHYKNNHLYAFNFTPKDTDWQDLDINGSMAYYNSKNNYNINQPLFFGALIDDQVSYIYGYHELDNTKADLRNALVFTHERFHYYQAEHFIADQNLPEYQGFNNLENITLAYLEAEVLKKYLIDADIEILKDFVAINRYRSTLLDSNSIVYEQQQERWEGIADYIAFKAVTMDSNELYKELISDYDRENSCSLVNPVDCVIKQRYYLTGVALGIALDRLSLEGWKETVEQNKRTPRELLLSLFKMEPAEIDARINNAKQQYHYEEMVKPIEKSIGEYQAKLKKQLEAYDIFSGIKTRFYSPWPCISKAGVVSSFTYRIDGKTSLTIDSESFTECTDGSITVKYSVPFEYNTLFYTEIKIDGDATILIDGEKITYTEFYSLRTRRMFHNLSILASNVSINFVNHSGLIISNGKDVRIKFDHQV